MGLKRAGPIVGVDWTRAGGLNGLAVGSVVSGVRTSLLLVWVAFVRWYEGKGGWLLAIVDVCSRPIAVHGKVCLL